MSQKIKAGWYRDPSTDGRQERYWDGSDWTDRVRDYAPPSASEGGSDKSAKRSGIGPRITVPFAVLLIGAGVIAYAVARGQDVKQVEVDESGLKVSFSTGDSVSESQVDQQQDELNERLHSLEERVGTAPQPPAPTAVDLSGDWIGANGFTYRIEQYGARAVISEMGPYGLTGVGDGVIDGTFLRFTYQAADGSAGQANLELVYPNMLAGTFTNWTSGLTTPAQMTR